jgi:dienelactone hydrolase
MKLVRSLFSAIIILLITASIACAVQIGPDPTSTVLNGDGPFAVTSETVSMISVTGFGGGTIYYPTTAGSYGVVVVAPGHSATNSQVMWFAKRLATHGFVTMAMNFISTLDLVEWRATQMATAVKYMTNSSSSTVRSRIDTSRRAVAGHSMGGGATLVASKKDSTLKAGIPMAPFSMTTTSFSTMTVPQMIMGMDGDTTASISSHATKFYNSIPTSTSKAYAVFNNAVHSTVTSTDERAGRYGVAWAKRFVDGDTRYSTFLCGDEAAAYNTSARFDSYQSNCPY